MATTRKEVELRITANDLGNKTLDELLNTFLDLKKAQDDFAKSGDASSRSLRDLKQDMTDLRNIGQQLASRGALLDLFDKTSQDAALAAEKVALARTALEKFQATQKEGATLTKKQSSEYANLQKSLASAEKNLQSATTRVGSLQSQLKSIGAEDTTKAKQSLVDFATQVGDSLRTSETAIRSYDTALRTKKEVEADAAQTTLKLADAQREALDMNRQFDAKVSFNKIGAEAVQAAQAIDVLTRDFDSLARSAAKGGDGIRAVLNPSGEAIKTLSGLENEITSLNTKLNSAKDNKALQQQLRELRGEYIGLATDAGKSATQIADNIARYKEQQQSLVSLRGEFEKARDKVVLLGEQMQNAVKPSNDLQRALAQAEGELSRIAGLVEREASAFANLKATLAAAGVDSAHLAQAEERLLNVAKQTADAQDKLGASTRRVGQGAKEAGTGLSFFEDSGRKTLSLTQRLRGEVLALAANYVGLIGALNLVKATFAAQQDVKSFEIKLNVANEGDLAKTGDDMRYIRAQADRLGVSFIDLGKGYADFSIAARGAGVSLKDTRAIFESFTEVSKVFRLTEDQTKGVFVALEQIFSKGKVEAQELRQQLGNQLSGAFNEFAKSLGISTQQVNKIMTDPNKGIPAKFLLLFAQNYRDKIGSQLPAATRTLSSEIGRLKSNVADLLSASANGNLENGLRDLIARLNQFITSSDGKKFASDLADGFTAAFNALRILVDYSNELVTAFKLLIGLKIATFFVGLGNDMTLLSTKAGVLTGAIAGIGSFISKAGSLIGAAFAGWQIGRYLDENFYVVHAFVVNIIDSVSTLVKLLPEYSTNAWERVKDVFYTSVAVIAKVVSAFMEDIAGKFGMLFDALSHIPGLSGLSDIAKSLRDTGGKAAQAFADGYDAKAGEALKKIQASNARIQKEVERFQKRQLDPFNQRQPIKALGGNPDGGQTLTDPAEIEALRKEAQGLVGDNSKKMEELAKSLSDDVSEIIQKLDLATEGNLAKQMEAAQQRFAILRGKLDQLGKSGKSITVGNETFSVTQVKELVDQYQKVVEQKIRLDFYTKQTTESQKEFNALVTADKDEIETVNNLVEAGLLTREQALQKLGQIDAKYAGNIQVEAKRATAALEALPTDVFAKLGGEKLVADIQKAVSGVQALNESSRENLFKKDIAEGEKAINDLLDVRRAKIDLINAEVQLGLKSELQGQNEILEVNKQYATDIESNAEKLRATLNAVPADLRGKLGVDKLLADLDRSILDVKSLKTHIQQLKVQLEGEFAQGASQAFVTIGQELGKVVTKSESWGDAFHNIRNAFLQFASDFLLHIAQMIAQQAILNALQSSSTTSGWFGIAAQAAAGSAHTGAVVGHGGMAQRTVNPSWFASAQRFHTGGFPGLRQGEVPAVLLKGEEVLSKADPRNALNGGTAAQQAGVSIVNVVDPSMAKDFMTSSEGERVHLNIIRRNAKTIKAMLQ